MFTTVLLDSGANLSAINEKMAKALKLEITSPSNQTPKQLYTANGSSMINKGSVTLELNINGRSFKQQFIVLSGLTVRILCGCDFMRNHRAVVDIAKGEVIFQGHLKFPLFGRQNI